MQLSPIAPTANERDGNNKYWRRDSLMEDLLDKPEMAIRLFEQSRMSESICERISGTYYGGELRTLPDERRPVAPLVSTWPEQGLFLVPPAFSDGLYLDPRLKRSAVSTQKYDEHSVAVGARLIAQALEADPERTVLWITPFREQALKLQSAQDAHFPEGNVTAGTVHTSQGSQADLVVFDPVNPRHPWLNGKIGQAIDIRRLLNVAISRARTQVIILCQREDIRKCSLLHELLHGLDEYQIGEDDGLQRLPTGASPKRVSTRYRLVP